MRIFTVCLYALSVVPVVGFAAAPAAQPGWMDRGEASWYGRWHDGKRTTSGEKFDSRKLTAAHSSLPMGSWVRVTVTETGRSIVVRVNDREPPHGVRCIDLSKAAAAKLGFVGRGVADVVVEQLSPDEARGQALELAEAPPEAPKHATHKRKAKH